MGTKQEEASGKWKASTVPFFSPVVAHRLLLGGTQGPPARTLQHLDWLFFCFLIQARSPSQSIRLRCLLSGKNKKRFHGLNSHSPLCLWHCAVSFPACSLGGHDVLSLLISVCQLWSHAHPAQSHHSASLGWVQEAKGPLSFPKP